jgi:hypothetical protein
MWAFMPKYHWFPFLVTVDGFEDGRGQIVPLKQASELKDRALIGDSVFAQFDAGEAPHRLRVIKRLFSAGVGQIVELLQAVDAQLRHQWQRNTAAARLRRLGVMRFYQGAEVVPGNHLVHLGKELLAAGLLLLLRVREAGERCLLHRWQPAIPGPAALSPIVAFRSEFP